MNLLPVLSGVEDPRECPVVLLQKVPSRFVFSLFSLRKTFCNIYSLAAICLVTITCNIIRVWLKYIEVRYINWGTVVRETLGLEIYCVFRVRTFPFTTWHLLEYNYVKLWQWKWELLETYSQTFVWSVFLCISWVFLKLCYLL